MAWWQVLLVVQLDRVNALSVLVMILGSTFSAAGCAIGAILRHERKREVDLGYSLATVAPCDTERILFRLARVSTVATVVALALYILVPSTHAAALVLILPELLGSDFVATLPSEAADLYGLARSWLEARVPPAPPAPPGATP